MVIEYYNNFEIDEEKGNTTPVVEHYIRLKNNEPIKVNLIETRNEDPITTNFPNDIKINDQLKEKEKFKILEIIQKYKDVFMQNNKPIKTTSLVQHNIYTDGSPPIHQNPYRVSHKERALIEEEVKKMIKDEVIRPSSSSWSTFAAPARFASRRSCADSIFQVSGRSSLMTPPRCPSQVRSNLRSHLIPAPPECSRPARAPCSRNRWRCPRAAERARFRSGSSLRDW